MKKETITGNLLYRLLNSTVTYLLAYFFTQLLNYLVTQLLTSLITYLISFYFSLLTFLLTIHWLTFLLTYLYLKKMEAPSFTQKCHHWLSITFFGSHVIEVNTKQRVLSRRCLGDIYRDVLCSLYYSNHYKNLDWGDFYTCRSTFTHAEVFCKKDVLKNFAKFTAKHLCQSLFFNKVACVFL